MEASKCSGQLSSCGHYSGSEREGGREGGDGWMDGKMEEGGMEEWMIWMDGGKNGGIEEEESNKECGLLVQRRVPQENSDQEGKVLAQVLSSFQRQAAVRVPTHMNSIITIIQAASLQEQHMCGL